MNVSMLLQMAAGGFGDRVAVGPRSGGVTYAELLDRAQRAATVIASTGAERAVLVDVNSDAVPLLLFASDHAGAPFVPLNYRLADEALRSQLGRTVPSYAVVDEPVVARVKGVEGVQVVSRSSFLEATAAAEPAAEPATDPEDIAVLLFTSGTTGEPKAAVLRHRHLVSYVISTVEYGGAGEDEAALVSVPPYHVAGLAAILSAVYAGRRLVYLPAFSADEWVEVAAREEVTHAMVVPTMLRRILDELEDLGRGLPALRHLSYGGGRMPLGVVERAMTLLPDVRFVNAYGLTETSSTIAVLGPDDHRIAFESDDPAVRARLQSVGRPLPTLELEIRDSDGKPLSPGNKGEIVVRGEQVAGEYVDRSALDAEGWFHTNDGGWIDADGYLHVDGRLDDVIVRGAENLSPGEIEDCLCRHPAVAEAAVIGVPDEEWGEAVAAVVVLGQGAKASPEELRDWVSRHLRSSRAPRMVAFRDELPISGTGKLLRRVLRLELAVSDRT